MDGTYWKTLLAKPAYTGALSGALFYFVEDEKDNLIILRQIVPGWLYVSLVTALASYAAELIDEFALPKIPDNPYSKYEGLLIAPLACGAATYLGLAATSTVPVPWFEFFKIGAGAQVISNFTWDSYVRPMLN